MATKITVKEAKVRFAELLEKLNHYDESAEFECHLDDNLGGSYRSDIEDFDVRVGADGVIYFENF